MTEVKMSGTLIGEGLSAANGCIYSRKALEDMLALLPGKPIIWAQDGSVVGQMSDDPTDFQIEADEDGQAAIVFRNASIERGSTLLRQVGQGVVREIGIGPEIAARVEGNEIGEVVRVESVGVTVDPGDLPFSSGRVTGLGPQGER